MFLHNFKYEFLSMIRQKDVIFWLMIFPLILGTFFYMAFGNLFEKETAFSKIPIAVVEQKSDEVFKSVMDSISSDESPLFDAEYTDEENALKLLKDSEIEGIIYVGDEISLSVTSSGIKPTIIRSFLEQYKAQVKIITDTAKNNPQQLQAVIDSLSADIDCNENIKLSNGNMDTYVQYFYNLIAMVALFGTTVGLMAAITNQGNLSKKGARKCVSPTPKLISTLAGLLAAFLVQTICVFVCITYLLVVLRVNLGEKIGMVYLSGALGALVGITFGFFLGAIGRMTENAKMAVAMSGSMLSCFLSGLMVGNMKAVIAEKCPIINKINPAAVISDLFYCLNIYDDYSRYIENAVILGVMTVVFMAGGFLMIRRRKYASI